MMEDAHNDDDDDAFKTKTKATNMGMGSGNDGGLMGKLRSLVFAATSTATSTATTTATTQALAPLAVETTETELESSPSSASTNGSVECKARTNQTATPPLHIEPELLPHDEQDIPNTTTTSTPTTSITTHATAEAPSPEGPSTLGLTTTPTTTVAETETETTASPAVRTSRRVRKRAIPVHDEHDMTTSLNQPKKDFYYAFQPSPQDKDFSLSMMQQILIQLLCKVRRKADFYGFFGTPVDPVALDCSTYYQTICPETEAMDFTTMETWIRTEKISSLDDFQRCMRRIIHCALKFNVEEDDVVRQQALQMEARAAPLIQKAKIFIQKNVTKGEPLPDETQSQSHTKRSSTKEATKHNKTSVDTEQSDAEDVEEVGIEGKRKTGRKSKKTRRKILWNQEIPHHDIPRCTKDLSSSTITPCSSRDEWLQTCPSMITVCNEAVRRSVLQANPNAENFDKPLSEVYMEERIQYDKPVNGYMVKSRGSQQFLQGFIIWTNFRIFRRTFRWTVDCPHAGITPTDRHVHAVDSQGTLTGELQALHRIGSNPDVGFVFDRVAEISFLGGIGCGGALLARQLSELRQSEHYDYVVLQATKMAIPFYERYGFVRVGAVTRLNDNELMPEVTYRHWSEIVKGEANEPSYMMALRLKDNQNKRRPHHHISRQEQHVSKKERQEEIQSALQSCYTLLREAITLRGSASHTYANSYKDLLTTARHFATSAEDDEIVHTITRSIDAIASPSEGKPISKRIIREALHLPISILKRSSTSILTINNSSSNIMDTGSVASNSNSTVVHPTEDGLLYRYVKVKVTANDDEILSSDSTIMMNGEEDPIAALPSRNVKVSLVVDGKKYYSYEKVDGRVTADISVGNPLSATLYYAPPTRDNANDIYEATTKAFENFLDAFSITTNTKRLATGRSLINSNAGPSNMILKDPLMVQVESSSSLPNDDNDDGGSLIWLPCNVKRRCTKAEIPFEFDSSTKNTFLIDIMDQEQTHSNIPQILDAFSNRGVGRGWCRQMDWFSFPLLPVDVLDSLLIGSWIQYYAIDERRVEGTIMERVGGGLASDVRWRVKLESNSSSPVDVATESFQDFSAIELRDVVCINDANMERTVLLLKRLEADPWYRFSLGRHGEMDSSIQMKMKMQAQSNTQDGNVWVSKRLDQLSTNPNNMVPCSREKSSPSSSSLVSTPVVGHKNTILNSNNSNSTTKKARKRKRKLHDSSVSDSLGNIFAL